MGVSVWIEKRNGDCHPAWVGGLAGERELWHHMMAAPDAQCVEDFEGAALYRPTDFAAFRRHPWYDDNEPHWRKIAEILEADPAYWLRFSY